MSCLTQPVGRFGLIVVVAWSLAARGAANGVLQDTYQHGDNDGVGYEDAIVDGYRRHRNFAPIHEAAKRGDVATIQGELAEGVPVDLRVANRGGSSSWRNTTPLMWAAARGRAAAVRALLEAGADPEATNDYGATPLMAAAGSIRTIDGDPLACIRILVKAGADLEAMDGRGKTALFYLCGAGAYFDTPPDELLLPEYRLPNLFALIRPDTHGSIGATYPFGVNVRRGDVQRLKALIEAGANVSARDKFGSTPLMTAAGAADVARLRALLEAGTDVNAHAEHGRTALMSAAAGGTGEMFEMLLARGADHEAVETRYGGQTVLIQAARSPRDSVRKVRALLASGADVTKADDNGQTALLASLRWRGGGDAVTLLLESGADPSVRAINGDSVFVLAAGNGPAQALEALLGYEFDLEKRTNDWPHQTPLILAARSTRDAAEKVRMLLAAGAGIESAADDGTTALLAASRAGNMKAVVLLVRKGANITVATGGPTKDESGHVRRRGVEGMTPLMYVANRGADGVWMCEQTGGEAVAVLIEKGADVDARDSLNHSALLLAAAIGDAEVLEAILAETPELDSKSVDSMDPDIRLEETALSVAIEHRNVDLVRSLVAAGANVNLTINAGTTPLMIAARKGDVAILKILFDANADVEAVDGFGKTALVYAIHCAVGWFMAKLEDGEAAARFLIGKGARIDVVDHDGRTPLMSAASGRSADLAKVLVEVGADPCKVNKKGETAVEIARWYWRKSPRPAPVVEYLETVSMDCS